MDAIYPSVLPKLLIFSFTFCAMACQGQQPEPKRDHAPAASAQLPVGGPCDGCELIFADMPLQIDPIDTSLAWPKSDTPLLINGRVMQQDQNPAGDVILYYWHTDHQGRYTPGEEQTGPSRRHGALRGWVKTDADGYFQIYTSRPAAYPGNRGPAHIHVLVKEADIEQAYYIDDWVFVGDPALPQDYQQRQRQRGGNGLLEVQQKAGWQEIQPMVILGLNIPNYPEPKVRR